MWGGSRGNNFDVEASHYRASTTWRTITTLNSGLGADQVKVGLKTGTDGFFDLNAQDGNDQADASSSTRPLVIFGGKGDDTINGGQGGDLIFGDEGRLIHADPTTGAP